MLNAAWPYTERTQMAKFAAVIPLVSAVLGIASSVRALTAKSSKAAEVNVPTAEAPASPAPVRRQDTGANITVGADSVKNQRVSGGGTKRRSNTTDFLGGLGAGSGLSI